MLKDDARLDESIAAAADLSRRTVTRGMAWSVPVVIAAVAAPATGGSENPQPPAVTFGPVSGLLDSSAGTIDFVLSAQSTAAGQIQFLQMNNGAATGLPTALTLVAGANTLKLSVTKSGIATGNVTLTYSLNGGKTTAQVTVRVSYPTVTFSNVSGVLDPAASKISFSMTAKSNGRGPVTFVKLNGSGTGLPFKKQLLAGDNPVKFDVAQEGLTSGTNKLTYTVGNGPEQTLDVPVPVPPTTYKGVSSIGNGAKPDITLTFYPGTASSRIEVKRIITGNDERWSDITPSVPTLSSVSGELRATFSAKRPKGNPAQGNVFFTIDNGSELWTGVVTL
jgi:hypothetical protein